MDGVHVRPAADHRAAVQRLAAAIPHAADGASLQELTEGCTLLDVMAGDAITGAIAVQLADGEAWVTATAASTRQDPVQAVQALEAWARQQGARRVAFCTRRPGMVRRMLAMGYGITRADIAKEL